MEGLNNKNDNLPAKTRNLRPKGYVPRKLAINNTHKKDNSKIGVYSIKVKTG